MVEQDDDSTHNAISLWVLSNVGRGVGGAQTSRPTIRKEERDGVVEDYGDCYMCGGSNCFIHSHCKHHAYT